MAENAKRSPTKAERNVDRLSRRRETQVRSEPQKPQVEVKLHKEADNRRIVGVLVSYNWWSGGKVFEVREGRTYIGRSQIKDDPEHRDVEVQCPMDDLLSGCHALILRQKEDFFIQDLASVNGTFVNEKRLRPETMEDLPNEAEIKVGKTVFTFVGFKRQSGAETQEEPKGTKDKRPPTVLR